MSKENGDLYFPHDFNAANDEKTVAFLSSCGAEGYGVFWLIVEQMHKNEGVYEKKEYNYRATAHRSLTTAERIKTILSDLVYCELFYEDDEGYYSERVIKNLEKSKKISTQNAENARKRKPKNSDRSATADIQDKTRQDKIKEEKKKDKKEKSPVPVEPPSDEVAQYPDFLKVETKALFEEYWKNRSKKKFAMTPRARKSLFKQLIEKSNSNNDYAYRMIERSLLNGWGEFWELKDNAGNVIQPETPKEPEITSTPAEIEAAKERIKALMRSGKTDESQIDKTAAKEGIMNFCENFGR